MVAEWTAEEDNEPSFPLSAYFGNNKLNLNRKQQDAHTTMLQNNTDARLSSQQSHQLSSEQSGSTNPAGPFDSNNPQKKFILLPFNHEDSQQWFYRDAKSVVRGPFSAAEMFEWYRAGYFVKELLIRRACDESFHPLGEVIEMWDRIPFAPLPMNVPPPPPITTQTLLQFRAVKQLEMAAGMNPSPNPIPPNPFGITHPGAVLLHGLLMQQQQQLQQQVHQVLAAASLNQNISAVPQEQQAGIRQILEATRQHEASLVQQQQRAAAVAAAAAVSHPGNVLDQNEMQTQLRQLLAQLKNREGFSNLNAQEQQEALVRQFVASRSLPGVPADQELLRARMMPFLPFFLEEERFRYQQRLELERRHKEEAEKQSRLIMEQRMKAEEEKQKMLQRKQKEESEKQRQEAEKDPLLKLSQLIQEQLAEQQEEFKQQMQNQQRVQHPQHEKKEQIERAKKAAQAQQVQHDPLRKSGIWPTSAAKPDQEPISLATLQREEERERQGHTQIPQSNQLQRQMNWASSNASPQSKPAAPVKAEMEEDRLAREKQKKTTVFPALAKAPPEALVQQPAWVFCTRYSDRPSSGPRTRRAKSKDKKVKDPAKASADEKRPRTAFTSEQLEKLRQEFQANSYLDEKRRKDLAERLCLNENQIKIWFQNKRAKMKKQTNQPNPLRNLLVAGGLYNHSTATSDCSESYANGNDHDNDEDDDDDDNDNSEIENGINNNNNNNNNININNNNNNKRRRNIQDEDGNLKFSNAERDTGMASNTGNKRPRLAHNSSEYGSDLSRNEDLDDDERVISVS